MAGHTTDPNSARLQDRMGNCLYRAPQLQSLSVLILTLS